MTAELLQFRQTNLITSIQDSTNMGVAASTLPEQESSSRYIPPEIMEEILLNLPIKSLLRFSTVSKSWNSMISDPGFISRHRTHAALPGRERVLIRHWGCLNPASTLPLSSISSNQASDAATPLIVPSEIEKYLERSSAGIPLLASCGELWCVENEQSLFLWNPSMRTYKKLPHPSIIEPYVGFHHCFYFGIGYDSIGDDYKILKMRCTTSPEYDELYSLRSDSWRKIQLPFPRNLYQYGNCVFACGVVYWVASSCDASDKCEFIVSFNLSTEKCAEVAQPPYDPVPSFQEERVELTVIRGKLCLHLNYRNIDKYIFWVMQECEGGSSWIKMLDIDYCSVDPYTQWSLEEGELVGMLSLTALYFYDNAKILIKAINEEYPTIFMHVDGTSIPEKVYRCYYDEYTSGELYVESLVSPATYCSQPRPSGTRPTAVAVGRKQPPNRIRVSLVWFWSFILYCVSISYSIIEVIFDGEEELIYAF